MITVYRQPNAELPEYNMALDFKNRVIPQKYLFMEVPEIYFAAKENQFKSHI